MLNDSFIDNESAAEVFKERTPDFVNNGSKEPTATIQQKDAEEKPQGMEPKRDSVVRPDGPALATKPAPPNAASVPSAEVAESEPSTVSPTSRPLPSAAALERPLPNASPSTPVRLSNSSAPVAIEGTLISLKVMQGCSNFILKDLDSTFVTFSL